MNSLVASPLLDPIGEARGISSTANNLSGNYTVHDNLVDIYE